MSATNVFEDGLLALIFQNTNYANVGDATGLRGSTTAGVFYISLHTTTPGETGSQNTTEAAYTSYARQSVNRASGAGGWAVASGTADNVSNITFPAATGGSETENGVGIGSAVSGVGNLFLKGALTASLAVSSPIQPYFNAGALDITLD